MSVIAWSEQLSMGIPEIDSQHSNLIFLLNRLTGIGQEGATRRELAVIVGEVLRYAETHFACEEKHMRQAGYPELDMHIMIHNKAKDRICNLLSPDVSVADMVRLLENFLVEWLMNHIMGADMDFANWLKRCGSQAVASGPHVDKQRDGRV